MNEATLPMERIITDGSGFVTKDTGVKESLAGGMVRNTEAGKADYTLVFTGPMFERWSGLLNRGAVVYGADNWLLATQSTDKADREKTKKRFLRSAARHFVQWMRGDTDEDHAAAIFFNVNGYEAMCASDKETK